MFSSNLLIEGYCPVRVSQQVELGRNPTMQISAGITCDTLHVFESPASEVAPRIRAQPDSGFVMSSLQGYST